MSSVSTHQPKRVNARALYAFGALGGLLFGYDTGIIAGAILYIKRDLSLDAGAAGLVVSSILIGAMIGGGVSGPLADRIGRRKLLLAAVIGFSIGAIGCGLSPDAPILILFRFMLGLAVGASSVVVPLYLSEMAPTAIRGTLTSLNQFMIIFGIFVANVVSFFLAEHGAWRWMLTLAIVPSLVMTVGVLYLPESPRWFVKRGRENEAQDVLARTRDASDAEREYHSIQQLEALQAGESWKTQLRSAWVWRLIVLGALLSIADQVTGINTVIYYIPTTLTDIGLTDHQALLSNIGIGALSVIAIGAVVAFRIVDRVGRKPLLLWGAVGMAASMVLLGGGPLLLPSQSWLVVLGSIAFDITFNLTWGPVMWVVLGEIFPLKVRGVAMSIVIVLHWASNALVSQTFPTFLSTMGPGPTFLMYAAVGVLVALWVLFFVPETKGLSLEEIEINARAKSKGPIRVEKDRVSDRR